MSDYITKLAERTETTFSIRYQDPDTGQMLRDRNAVRICEVANRWMPDVEPSISEVGWKLIRRLGTGDWLTRVQLGSIVDYLDEAIHYYRSIPAEHQPYPQRNEEAIQNLEELMDLVIEHD